MVVRASSNPADPFRADARKLVAPAKDLFAGSAHGLVSNVSTMRGQWTQSTPRDFFLLAKILMKY